MSEKEREATGFQEHAAYDESIDLRTDFVMAYGMDDTIADRIERWRAAGYRVGFTEYLVEKLRPIIELGVDGVHLEEPEFWARTGYAESFKREWLAFYNEPWEPAHTSPDALFESGGLMQHLLSRSLDRVTSVC